MESASEAESPLAKAEALVRQADELYVKCDEARGKIIGFPPSEKAANEAESIRLESEGNLIWLQIGDIIASDPDLAEKLVPTHPRSQKRLRRFQ